MAPHFRFAEPWSPRPRDVAVLVYEGLHLFEFGCVHEVMAADRLNLGDDWYRVRLCSLDGPRVRTNGFVYEAAHDLDTVLEVGTIIIPGWPTSRDPPEDLLKVLRAAYRNGARLAAICSGAFVLAAAGLLDGKRATTHWAFASMFAERFPQVRLDPEVLYIEDDRTITSAGSAAGIDMLLDMVRGDFGSQICNSLARRLVIPPHRSGSQLQFIERPVPQVRDNGLMGLMTWIRENAREEHSISDIAKRGGMSTRTLFRRFRDVVGMTPQDFIIHERLAVARSLLERDQLPLIRIAEGVGFHSLDTFRHHFKRVVGQTPTEYRRRFSSRRSAA